jgi:beta-glucanase (GH16 family)
VGARPAGLATLSIAADVARRRRASTGPARYRRLVWFDGFNGRSERRPNPAHWRYDAGIWDQGSLDVDTRSRANVRTDGHGRLVITARRAGRNSPRPYTSGRIETAHRFSFTYGRLEARIKLPNGAGLWPTFWMLGDSIDAVGWPQAGEIDVMENFGQRPRTVFGTIHGPVASGSDSSFQIQSRATRASLVGRFHTYGVIWQPGRITWTLDGRTYGTARESQLPAGSWVFNNEPFHILLSLAVGGPNVGPPHASTRFPARMLVDWIRLYQ